MKTFTINFRREVFLRERARSRARLLALGGWMFYFGLLGLVVGLYGLNLAALSGRAGQIERQALRLEGLHGGPQEWAVDQAQLAMVESFRISPRRCRDKLARLSVLLPPNVAITGISLNPQSAAAGPDRNKLVIAGQLRQIPGQDQMRGVVQIVSALQRDAVFGAGFQTVKLTQSRVIGESPVTTEFVIECR